MAKDPPIGVVTKRELYGKIRNKISQSDIRFSCMKENHGISKAQKRGEILFE